MVAYRAAQTRWELREDEMAHEAAEQRKRGIVVVKLHILLSYSERQRDLR